jgi:hypothetical protein
MENRVINIAVVAEVAKALKQYKQKMVFVGGAVISLYTDDPAADEIRPTADIDMTLRLMSFNKWAKTQEELASLGFHPNPFGHAICSYTYKDILIDIMPSEDGPLGPANRWYKYGFDNLMKVKALNEEIYILPAPCYLATKFEAFNNRGKDYRTSHDFEDIIYVIDNRTTIVQEIENTKPEIREFLQNQFVKLKANMNFEEILSAQIHPLVFDERIAIIESKISEIIGL